jgi:putative ABC transport system permease protein
MFRIYFLHAFRIYIRNPLFPVFAVLGLSLSFVVAFILWQHTTHELDSDKFHRHSERIVRAGLSMRWSDDKSTWEESLLGINTPELANKIGRENSSIEEYTRILHRLNFNNELIGDHEKQVFITLDQQSFIESKVVYADSNLLSFFSIPLIQGSPDSALRSPNALLLSRKTALKYFGNEKNIIGKTVHLNNSLPLVITGVFEDLPQNSHLDFEVVFSSKRIRHTYDKKLEISVGGPHCYFKIKTGTDISALQQEINEDLKPTLRQAMYNNPYRTLEVFLQPLKEIPFSFHRLDQHTPKSAYFLSVARHAAWIILLIGLVNYVNLLVSSNGIRLKELAAKKSMGANFQNFAKQFIFESCIIYGVSLLLAATILIFIKSPAKFLLGFYVPSFSELTYASLITSVCVVMLATFVTSLYPAVIFFKLNPRKLFQLARIYNTDNLLIRILSTFQYTSSIFLLIVAFVISHQLYFILDKGLGVKKGNTLIVDLSLNSGVTHTKLNSFIERISEIKNFEEYTLSHSMPGDNGQFVTGLKKTQSTQANFIESNGGVDANFLPFFYIQLVAGRNFKNDTSDNKAVILSEGAMQRLGFNDKKDALGKIIFTDAGAEKKIVGIIRDYKLKPLLRSQDYLYYGGNTGIVLSFSDTTKQSNSYPKKIALRAGNAPLDMSSIKKIYESVFPNSVFVTYYLEDVVNSQYYHYRVSHNQLIFFLIAMVLIAGLGLFAMLSLKVQTKTKEIGVRKVLGANIMQIMLFLLRNWFRQILIAALLAAPIAYYLINQYFSEFEERIQIAWYHFAIPLMVFIIFMLVPVANLLITAANTNPVESLKHE